jgi:hypothetical protein
MTEPHTYKRSTRNAIAKYGLEACKRAFYLNRVVGEGPCLIGGYGRGCVQRADAMINAGEDIQATDGANAVDAICKGEY